MATLPSRSTSRAVPRPYPFTSDPSTQVTIPDRFASSGRGTFPAPPARDRSYSPSSSESKSDRPQSPRTFQQAAVQNHLEWRASGDVIPTPYGAAPTSQAPYTADTYPVLSVTPMSRGAPTGLAAMPTARSPDAPRFSGQGGEILSEFLHEYEDLADGNGLSERQKVETILRYVVPRSVRRLWSYLPGYKTRKWSRFRDELDFLYPDNTARCTRRDLTEFLELSASSRIHDENDIMEYYRGFLTIASPLVDEDKLSDYDFKAEFFKGFHADDQDILADQVFKINPHHPVNKPFNVEDVVSAARQYFTSNRFHKPLQLRVRNELRGQSKTRRRDPEKFIQKLFGDSRPPKRSARNDTNSDSESEEDGTPRSTYENRSVRFKESSSDRAQTKDEDDAIALVTKLSNLSVHDHSYHALYSQCLERFPNIAKHIPKPELSPSAPYTSSTVDPATILFSKRNGARTRGCVFCGMLGHRIRGCALAEEYFLTGRVKIVSYRLHLPTGQPIPNDGRGLGLKASVDAWLAANTQPPSSPATSTPQRDPPHATSYVNANTTGLDDTKKKDSNPPKAPAPAMANPAPAPAPSTSNCRSPQDRYQASAEEQALTKELLDWILEGKLGKVTLAHILAASPSVREELVEQLEHRRVETASFEQADCDDTDRVLVL